jgi:hypothetical protein
MLAAKAEDGLEAGSDTEPVAGSTSVPAGMTPETDAGSVDGSEIELLDLLSGTDNAVEIKYAEIEPGKDTVAGADTVAGFSAVTAGTDFDAGPGIDPSTMT